MDLEVKDQEPQVLVPIEQEPIIEPEGGAVIEEKEERGGTSSPPQSKEEKGMVQGTPEQIIKDILQDVIDEISKEKIQSPIQPTKDDE